MQKLPVPFDAIRSRHAAIIVSPPRCGSTALARVFWEHPSVLYYSHEPFEVTYYRSQRLAAVAEKLNALLDLAAINAATDVGSASSLVIKEICDDAQRIIPNNP